MAANVEALPSLVEIDESKMNDVALSQPNESVCPSLFGVRSKRLVAICYFADPKAFETFDARLISEVVDCNDPYLIFLTIIFSHLFSIFILYFLSHSHPNLLFLFLYLGEKNYINEENDHGKICRRFMRRIIVYVEVEVSLE